jgi:hypothetical protein
MVNRHESLATWFVMYPVDSAGTNYSSPKAVGNDRFLHAKKGGTMALRETPDDFERRGVFTLPDGVDGGGFVTVWAEDESITIELSPARAKLVLLLNKALRDDRDTPMPARGWRSVKQIIAELESDVEEASLRRTVSEINGLFKEAAQGIATEVDIPVLLATKRKIGVRLNWQLETRIPVH